MKQFIYVLAVMVTALPLFSQTKRIVVVGSSTAAGVGPTEPANSYVNRLTYFYKDHLGMVDAVCNIAYQGTNQFQAVPTSSPWPGYITHPQRNITKANQLLADLPDPANGVIIVHFPSNEMLTNSLEDIMACFRIIYNEAVNAGHKCYVTTTQPRSDFNYRKPEGRAKMIAVKDAILAEFKEYAIDFWTGFYDAADGTIIDKYEADQIHMNDLAHEELFNRVVRADIFGESSPTPVVWGDFTAEIEQQRVKLQWSTLQEENTSHFIVEHSTNGKDYTALAKLLAKGHSSVESDYGFIHLLPNVEGYNFYRIKQVDLDEKATWTPVRTVQFRDSKAITVRMSPNPVQNILKAEVVEKDVFIAIVDMNGRSFKRMKLAPGVHNIDLQALPAGSYHVVMYKNSQWIATKKIVKM